jgi:phosphoribosylformimino-5-aminoimidazole carboxamide ribotide isomerase
MRLLPAIDLRDGRCVRLLQGRFDAETVYATDPHEVLADYRALGAVDVHVVDLDRARGAGADNRAVIAALASESRARLQVGGGVRSRQAIDELIALGVRRVVVGSRAVTDPDVVDAWLRTYGADVVVIALDVRIDADGTPRLATHGWQQQNGLGLWQAVERLEPAGLRHVLCTDIARDGTLTGPNVGLYAEAVRRFPRIQWQASGGVRDADDLRRLEQSGVAAAVCGRALLDRRMTGPELQPFLLDA